MTMRMPGTVPGPEEIYAIHEERAAGLTARQIGARHELSGVTVSQFLRPRTNTTLPIPYELSKTAGSLAIPMYWLGFITASGRASHRSAPHTVVLSLDPGDLEFVQLLGRDLLRTHASYEFCHSSHDGHQVYIRERDLGESVLQWGVTTDPREAALPVDYSPAEALPHFLRGLLEGQMRNAPFGGRTRESAMPSPRLQRLTIPGSPLLLDALRRRLRQSSATLEGVVEAANGTGAGLTFRGAAVEALLRYAYRDPLRSSPRADKFVKAFAVPQPA
ncbi:MAG: hypothetical protein ACREN5_12390 [Gemmatimonadales bacterium]